MKVKYFSDIKKELKNKMERIEKAYPEFSDNDCLFNAIGWWLDKNVKKRATNPLVVTVEKEGMTDVYLFNHYGSDAEKWLNRFLEWYNCRIEVFHVEWDPVRDYRYKYIVMRKEANERQYMRGTENADRFLLEDFKTILDGGGYLYMEWAW